MTVNQIQQTIFYDPQYVSAKIVTSDLPTCNVEQKQLEKTVQVIRAFLIEHAALDQFPGIEIPCKTVLQGGGDTALYFSKNNAALGANRPARSFYILSQDKQIEVYVTGSKSLNPAENRASTIKTALRMRFTRQGELVETELVAKLSVRLNQKSLRRIAIMQTVSDSPYFPTNYAYIACPKKEPRLDIYQERARCDLYDFLRKNSGKQKLPRSTQLRFAEELLRAVDLMHQKQIIHRDLKAENVLVFLDDDKEPHLKVTDFEFSCFEADTLSLKETSGTFCWAAPELITHCKDESPPSLGKPADLWGVGLILYFLQTKKMPQFVMDLEPLHKNIQLQKENFELLEQFRNNELSDLRVLYGDDLTDEELQALTKEEITTTFHDLILTYQKQIDAGFEKAERNFKSIPAAPQVIKDRKDLSLGLLQPDPTKRLSSSQALEAILQLVLEHPQKPK